MNNRAAIIKSMKALDALREKQLKEAHWRIKQLKSEVQYLQAINSLQDMELKLDKKIEGVQNPPKGGE